MKEIHLDFDTYKKEIEDAKLQGFQEGLEKSNLKWRGLKEYVWDITSMEQLPDGTTKWMRPPENLDKCLETLRLIMTRNGEFS